MTPNAGLAVKMKGFSKYGTLCFRNLIIIKTEAIPRCRTKILIQVLGLNGLLRFCRMSIRTSIPTCSMPIIERTCEIAGVKYHVNEEHDIAFKVIADHIRTVAFAVGDGVMPSNEGRGYVIRRLLSRAVRYGKTLGVDRPFLHELVKVVGDIMGVYYPEVVEKREFIEKVIRTEEERFHETLSDGLALLADLASWCPFGRRTANQRSGCF